MSILPGNSKEEIRRKVQEARNAYPREAVLKDSLKICSSLMAMKEYKEASHVFLYMASSHEVDTAAVLKNALASGKKVYIPKVIRMGVMEFYQIFQETDVESGSFGILEPLEGMPVAQVKEGFMVMPGVAFDRKLRRIGYGGGYYDRYLEQVEEGAMFKAALAFDFQVFPSIPAQAWDIPIDGLITPTMVMLKSD